MTTARTMQGTVGVARWTATVMMVIGLAGCVQIDTPDKPIVITLNINIKQEIVYRLDGDAKQLIEQKSEIF
jgi:YnbE-like lipoprotein